MVRKIFCKKWWVWAIAIVVVLGVVGSAGKAGKKATSNNEVVKNETSSAKLSENKNEKKEEPVKGYETRDNSSANETTLSTGKFVVGEDIPAGRYVCTSDSSGNFIVTNKNGLPIINEILGNDDLGVSKVTSDFKDGEKIEISGIKNVHFAPAETKVSNELSAGSWVVGLDIEPGKYVAEVNNGQGNFVVYKNGFPTVNEILDASGDMGVPNVTLKLEKGEVISISGLNQVLFTRN